MLPSSYDANSTLNYFLVIISLFLFSYAFRHFLYISNLFVNEYSTGEICNEKKESCNVKTHSVLKVILYSGVLLSVVGSLQRYTKSEKLLWFFDRSFISLYDQSFGPFGYRGNAAAFLNMIYFISLAELHVCFVGFKDNYSKPFFAKFLILCFSHLLILFGLYYCASRSGILINMFLNLVYLGFIAIKYEFFKKGLKLFLFLLFFTVIFTFSYPAKFLAKPFIKGNIAYQIYFSDGLTDSDVHIRGKHIADNSKNGFNLFLVTDRPDVEKSSYIFRGYVTNNELICTLEDKILNNGIYTIFDLGEQLVDNEEFNVKLIIQDGKLLGYVNNHQVLGRTVKTQNKGIDWNFVYSQNFIKVAYSDDQSELSNNFQFSEIRIKQRGTENKYFSINLDTISGTFDHLKRQFHGRQILLQAGKEVIRENWVYGIGLNTWSKVYTLYKPPGLPTHAWLHCDPMEFLTSLGVVGILPIFFTFVKRLTSVLTTNLLLNIKQKPIRNIGILFSIFSVFINSLVDFPLQIFSICFYLTVLLSLNDFSD